MRAFEFIVEGYKEAQTEFVAQHNNPEEVLDTISKFRDLVNRNQLQGEDRNIDVWRKKGWPAFMEFVLNRSTIASKTKVKRKSASGETIVLRDDAEWSILIPLDKEASANIGRKTGWCISKPNQDHFYDYTARGAIFVMCTDAQGFRMCLACYPNGAEAWTSGDDRVDLSEFDDLTELSSSDLYQQAEAAYAADPRSKNIRAINENPELIHKIKNPSKLEIIIAANKNPEVVYKMDLDYATQLYIAKNGTEYPITAIKNPHPDVQLAAVTKNGFSIFHITGEISPKVQIASIRYFYKNLGTYCDSEIQQLINFIGNNITPEAEAEIVKHNPDHYQFLHNPSQHTTAMYQQLSAGSNRSHEFYNEKMDNLIAVYNAIHAKYASVSEQFSLLQASGQTEQANALHDQLSKLYNHLEQQRDEIDDLNDKYKGSSVTLRSV